VWRPSRLESWTWELGAGSWELGAGSWELGGAGTPWSPGHPAAPVSLAGRLPPITEVPLLPVAARARWTALHFAALLLFPSVPGLHEPLLSTETPWNFK
jgi:hypothetical protein